jgi:hypothetical protein
MGKATKATGTANRTLVRENGGKVEIYISGKWIRGGKDDRGYYYTTKCAKCGEGLVKQYIGKRGPKALYCEACRTSSTVRVEDGKVITKRGILEIVEE